jgi:hypothetical protein
MPLAFVGEAGNAILFICLLMGVTVVSLYVLAFVARCLLVVVQGTAIGEDLVTWPEEPFLDWLLGSAHLAVLVLLWLVPIGFLSRGLRDVWLKGQDGLRLLLMAAPGLWLIFPVGLLSSLSSSSRWVFFRPAVVGRLLRLFSSTALFYLLSAAVTAAGAGLWYLALLTPHWWALPLAAGGGAALTLIYARLLGRLAWLVRRLDPPRAPAAETKKVRKKPRKKPRRRRPEPEPTPEPEPEAEARPAKGKARSPWGGEVEQDEGYGLAAAGPEPTEAPTQSELYESAGEDEEDEEEQEAGADEEAPEARPRRPRPPEPEPGPAWPFFQGVLGFPWTDNTLRAWLWLSFGALVTGFGVSLLMKFWPGG